MLYSEFLDGTFEPNNKWTFKEYERIEAIYNKNDKMTKEEAYKLFREPDAFTLELLNDIDSLEHKNWEKTRHIRDLEKEIEQLTQKVNNLTHDMEHKYGLFKEYAQHIVNIANL